MSFAAWTFLLGIAAVAGPVMAHFLAKPRYRRVPFTMLQFLKSSQIESHSRRNLRDLLLLLLRCTIIVLIAFLFAQPIIFRKAKSSDLRDVYYLGLDDSASMGYTDGGDTYFKKMKDSAVDYIVTAKSDAVFNICTLVSGNWNYGLSRQQALAQVQALNLKSKRADIGALISGLTASTKNSKPGDKIYAYLISDFTGNMLGQFLNIQEPAIADNIQYKIISSSKAINNASIVTAGASDFKNNRLSIDVTINNNGQTHQSRSLYALIESKKTASANIELNPGQSKTFPLIIEADSIKDLHSSIPIELILTPNDNLRDDDKFYLAVQLPNQIDRNVLLVETEKDEMFLMETAIKSISEKNPNITYNVRRLPFEAMNSASLNRTDIFICPKIPDTLTDMAKPLSDFTAHGGRAIFFLNDEPLSETASKLFQQKVLAALPTKYLKEQANIEISPISEQFTGFDRDAMKALANYRIDKIALNGYWNCRPLPESACVWQFQNGEGFIYYKKQGNGSSTLVNTSVDNSLGSLLKSSASVALCQCLLGAQNKILNSSFACDERIILPLRSELSVRDSAENVSERSTQYAERPGWVKTLSEPIIYAGVNLPAGETNMAKIETREVENAVSRGVLIALMCFIGLIFPKNRNMRGRVINP